MWLTVFKVFLIAFLIISIAVIVIVVVRRSRANRRDPRWTSHNTEPDDQFRPNT
jgi:heme/copper-type cytochrome/quinol oxidase subunit 2